MKNTPGLKFLDHGSSCSYMGYRITDCSDNDIAQILNSPNLKIGEAKANAILFTVAPELLNVLKELVLLMDVGDPVEVGCHCADSGDGLVMCPWCKAKAVIAQVEGKEKTA